MKQPIITLIILIAFIGCKENSLQKENKSSKNSSINELIENLENSKNDQIIVIAHRGDWRNAPENSIQAIQNCIDMGVDMVEIDIRETNDGHLILMHDETIDRTTNGAGYVKDWTLDSLKALYLIDGLGVKTKHKIPTLKEALLVSKDRILINLDKSYKLFDKCYNVIKETGTLNQVVIKGVKTREEVEKEFGEYLDDVYFMPIIPLPNENAKEIVDSYLQHRLPIAFEFVVPQDTMSIIKDFRYIRERGSGVWVNSLWSHHNGGHDDEKAVLDPQIYDWFIENNIDMIQTDRPLLLINYLREKGLHR